MGKFIEKIDLKQFKWGIVLGVITTLLMFVSYKIGVKRGESLSSNEADNEVLVIDEREIYVAIETDCSEYPSGREVNDGKETFRYCLSYNEDETAFDALVRLDEGDDDFSFDYTKYDFGVFIESINSYHPDSKDKFWAFYVNGKQPNVGVSDYKVLEGDVLSFKLEEF